MRIRDSVAFVTGAPLLAKNGGGAIVNVLSVLSWVTVPTAGTYSASKAAAWALTNWLRTGLREQGTQMLGLHVGPVARRYGESTHSSKGQARRGSSASAECN